MGKHSDSLTRDVGAIVASRRWWYVSAPLALVLTAAMIVAPVKYGGWLTWLGDLLQAVYVTLTFSLVVLTYRLFEIASGVSSQSERYHRISILPVVTCRFGEFKEDNTIDLTIDNLGEGTAFDVLVSFQFRPLVETADGTWKPDTLNLDADSTDGIHVSVLRKGTSNSFEIDLTSSCITGPWDRLNLKNRVPNAYENVFLFTGFALVASVQYLDIYGSAGSGYYCMFTPPRGSFETVALNLPRVDAPPADKIGFSKSHFRVSQMVRTASSEVSDFIDNWNREYGER